jgi:hypothetical protein
MQFSKQQGSDKFALVNILSADPHPTSTTTGLLEHERRSPTWMLGSI